MQKKFLFSLFTLFCLATGLLASPYDLCKDILRDGVRDTLSKNDTLEKKLSSHHQFCSIAKNHKLSDANFESFAKDYSKSVRHNTDTYGGGASVGWGPFSFGANYQQGNSSSNLSESDKINLLKNNKKEVVDYFDKNCGDTKYEEYLRSEAALLSKVANPNVVSAWRKCMLKKTDTGFFVELIPTSSDLADDEIVYNAGVHWKSRENTQIKSIVLEFDEGKIFAPYQVAAQHGGFAKTVNICDSIGCSLVSGSKLSVPIRHKDRKNSASVTITAINNTGWVHSEVLILPKLVLPDPVTFTATNNTTKDPELISAVFKQKIDQVRKLLSKGKSPFEAKADGATAIDFALWGESQIIRDVVVNSQNPIINNETPLINAVFNNNEPMIDKLMANGADQSLKKSDGADVFHFALSSGNKKVKDKILYPSSYPGKISRNEMYDNGKFNDIKESNWQYFLNHQKPDKNNGITQHNFLLEFSYLGKHLVSLNLRSGYIRFKTGEPAEFGTSVELFPTLYMEESGNPEKDRVQLDIDVELGDKNEEKKSNLLSDHYSLVIDASVNDSLFIQFKVPDFYGLDLFYYIKIDKPKLDKIITAYVINSVRQNKPLRLNQLPAHRFERFSLAILSSMHTTDHSQWDCQRAVVSNDTFPLNPGVFVSRDESDSIQLVGGNGVHGNNVKNDLPTISIKNMVAKDKNANPIRVHAMGHMFNMNNPDEDNVGLWLATPDVPAYYSYTIEAKKP